MTVQRKKTIIILFLFILIGLYKSSGFYACSICYETAFIDRVGSFGIAFFSEVEPQKNDIYKFMTDIQIVPSHKHRWHCYETSLTNIFIHREHFSYSKHHPLMKFDEKKIKKFDNFYQFFGKENTKKLFTLYKSKKINFENIFLKQFPYKEITNSDFASWCKGKNRIKNLFPQIVLDDNQKWLNKIYKDFIEDQN
ncbi:hypothetical protein [Candidatus Uabimicrobium sp. HlEnr_7]|uniref:hypothetical protein n=1 Tax=Candidatus Uabimicrobium helgolandensis TaxID=3095367 RepID=UPI003555FE9E